MFKKSAEAKLLQRLSGADKKKLRRTVKEKFPRASDADVDVILPPKAEITVAKFPNRAHLYGIEGGFPMIFDVDGRGTEIYPTVYALWMVPDLLPAFMLKGGEVSRYVIGGADLMFPGICIPLEGLPSFLAGQPWAVKVPGNPAPIAVGATTMSSTEALKAGLRGKALRIMHYYRDSLWQVHCTKESVEGHYVPNAGFLEDVVFEDPALASINEASKPCEVTGSSSNDPNDVDAKRGEEELVLDSDAHMKHQIEPSTPDGIKKEISEDVATDLAELNVADGVSSEKMNDEKDQHILSVAEVDALLDKCLLQALHTIVNDKDLPMPGSTLWPSGVTLDIKKSSYKKLSKWLQAKSSAGLILAKEDKHKKEVILFAVNHGHADYKSFVPEKRQPETVEQPTDSTTGEGHQSKSQLEIAEIYKSSTHVNPIFNAIGADTGRFYSAAEATDVAFKYIEKENLVKPTNKAIAILDAIFCDALYKGTVKKGMTYPTEIHKKDVGSTFLNRMQVHHRVTRGNESAVRKGAIKNIQILTERRQGNKKVTKVSGVESFLIDAEAFASELQKKFACSTSVADLPGKKGSYEVLVQGGVIDDLARHLVEHYGIPKRYIEVLDKTRR
ncbi:hypothetical protein QJS04_geneDACA009956 [Acorus gramineus]|uniref:SUI1 domain-containing protein n=1 Tax=Acorus gramineus TaxID=55184 RepID=A0AAV9BF45_ACOGR|nr:hypothetical protein QJS04_geneDACA009956 [Acorus gramineus]